MESSTVFQNPWMEIGKLLVQDSRIRLDGFARKEETESPSRNPTSKGHCPYCEIKYLQYGKSDLFVHSQLGSHMQMHSVIKSSRRRYRRGRNVLSAMVFLSH